MSEINFIDIDTAVDDRGYLRFSNSFNLQKYLRFYDVINFESRFIRAWHGHKVESKAAIVRSGSAMFCLIEIDNWKNPSKNLEVKKFFLSEEKPKVLEIPPGFVHGFISLEPKTKITFYSDKSLKESLVDDFRFEYDFWNPWQINYR